MGTWSIILLARQLVNELDFLPVWFVPIRMFVLPRIILECGVQHRSGYARETLPSPCILSILFPLTIPPHVKAHGLAVIIQLGIRRWRR
jgi:hypothetical protein